MISRASRRSNGKGATGGLFSLLTWLATGALVFWAPGSSLVWSSPAQPLPIVQHAAVGLRAAPARQRQARPVATCQVHVIRGLHTPGQFPKQIRHLRSSLDVRPFSRFLSFELLKTASLQLFSRQQSRVHTVGPYWLEAELLGQVVSSRRVERLRFILSLERRAEGRHAARNMLRSTLVLDRGGTLFLAGPRHGPGTLVFGVTCR